MSRQPIPKPPDETLTSYCQLCACKGPIREVRLNYLDCCSLVTVRRMGLL